MTFEMSFCGDPCLKLRMSQQIHEVIEDIGASSKLTKNKIQSFIHIQKLQPNSLMINSPTQLVSIFHISFIDSFEMSIVFFTHSISNLNFTHFTQEAHSPLFQSIKST